MDSRLNVKIGDKGIIEISMCAIEIEGFAEAIFPDQDQDPEQDYEIKIQKISKGKNKFATVEITPEYYLSIYNRKKHSQIYDTQSSLVQLKFSSYEQAIKNKTDLDAIGVVVIKTLTNTHGMIYKDLTATKGIDCNENGKYIIRIDKDSKEKYDFYFQCRDALVPLVEDAYRNKINTIIAAATDSKIEFPFNNNIKTSNQLKFQEMITFLEKEAGSLAISHHDKSLEEVRINREKWVQLNEIADSVRMGELENFKAILQKAQNEILLRSECLLEMELRKKEKENAGLLLTISALQTAISELHVADNAKQIQLDNALQTIYVYQQKLSITSERLSNSQNNFLSQSQLSLQQQSTNPPPYYPYYPQSHYGSASDPRLFNSSSTDYRNPNINLDTANRLIHKK